MSRATDRRAFLDRIAADPYDRTTRLVFADWLEEYGNDRDHEEAIEQRRRATPEWEEADRYLRDFAVRITETDYDPKSNPHPGAVTVEEVIEAGKRFVDGGGSSCLSGCGFTAENLMDEPDERAAFWKHWETWTGIVLNEDKRSEGPFSCCY